MASLVQWISVIKDSTSTADASPSHLLPFYNPNDGQRLSLREDSVSDGGYAQAIIRNAKHSDDDMFVVPKVVDLEDS